MHNNGIMPDFQFWFSFIQIYFFKCYQKILSKLWTILIYNNYSLVFLGRKSGIIPLSWSLHWCQLNLFHLVAMDNECLKPFWTFKNSTLEKCSFILFLIWKWIKYIFLSTICIIKMPGVKSIAMKSIITTILNS